MAEVWSEVRGYESTDGSSLSICAPAQLIQLLGFRV